MTGSEPDIIYVGDAASSPHIKQVKEMIARDWDKMRAELAEFSANADWVADNREALRKDYAGKYIAVLDQKVRASHEDFSEVLEEIDRKGIDRRRVFTDHIYEQDPCWTF